MSHRTAAAAGVLALTFLLAACSDGRKLTEPEGQAALPATLVLTPGVDTLDYIGDTAQLNASLMRSDGVSLPATGVVFSSSNSEVVQVDGAGRARAIKVGAVTVTARVDTSHASAVIVVRQLPSSIAITGRRDTIGVGERITLSAIVKDQGGTAIANAGVTWQVSDASIARIDSAGRTTGHAEGSVTVTAKTGTIQAATTFNVYPFAAARVRILSRGTGRPGDFLVRAGGITRVAMSTDTLLLYDHLLRGDFAVNVTSTSNHCLPTPGAGNVLLTGKDTPTVTIDVKCTGDITFERYPSDPSNCTLYYLDKNGAVVLLVPEGVVSGTSSRSHDGTRVAYARIVGSRSDLYVMDLATRVATRLTNDEESEEHIAWSRDDRRIVYDKVRGDQIDGGIDYTINIIDATGAAPPLLFLDPPYGYSPTPTWSPSGNRLAYVAWYGGFHLFTIAADGTSAFQVTRGPEWAYQPAWSGDGSKIVYLSSTGVWRVNADGTRNIRLSDRWHGPVTASFSKDQQVILMDNFSRIGLVPADGGVVTWLTDDTDYNHDARWIDESTIVFANPNGIYVMERDGSYLHRVVTLNVPDRPLPRPN